MKRFKLSRKEKLLFATPLLLVVLALAWPLVSAFALSLVRDSLDDTLHELAGPQAIDCGVSPTNPHFDPCAIAAIKADQPFIIRHNFPVTAGGVAGSAIAYARTPQGEFFYLEYARPSQKEKFTLLTVLKPHPRVVTSKWGPVMKFDKEPSKTVSRARVWR